MTARSEDVVSIQGLLDELQEAMSALEGLAEHRDRVAAQAGDALMSVAATLRGSAARRGTTPGSVGVEDVKRPGLGGPSFPEGIADLVDVVRDVRDQLADLREGLVIGHGCCSDSSVVSTCSASTTSDAPAATGVAPEDMGVPGPTCPGTPSDHLTRARALLVAADEARSAENTEIGWGAQFAEADRRVAAAQVHALLAIAEAWA